MKNTSHVGQIGFSGIGIFTALFVTALFGSFGIEHAQAEITSQLELGSSGSQVTELQEFLAEDPSVYPKGIVSGYFGALTVDAVKKFQVKYGISPVGRVGYITMIKINTLNQNSSSPYRDVNAPTMSNIHIQLTADTATFTWNTSEPAASKIYFGTTYPFLYATAPTVYNTSYSTSHNLTLQALVPGRAYYYTLESVDASGNVTWTLETFLAR